MVRNLFSFLMCAAVLPLASCRRAAEQGSGLVIQSEILPSPPRVGTAIIMLSLSDSSAKPVTGATLSVEGNMTHAGMAPVFYASKEVQPGRYRSEVAFSMPGDWAILVHVTLPDGIKLERQIDVPGVAAN